MVKKLFCALTCIICWLNTLVADAGINQCNRNIKEDLGQATLTIEVSNFSDTCKYYIIVWDELFIPPLDGITPYKIIHPKASNNGKLIFRLDSLRKCSYFSFLCDYEMGNVQQSMILYYYFVEPGDHVKITINNLIPLISSTKTRSRQTGWQFSDIRFEGTGSLKYKCRREIDKLGMLTTNLLKLDSLGRIKLSHLEKYRNAISNISYDLLLADLIGEIANNKHRYITLKMLGKDKSANSVDVLYHLYKTVFDSTWVDIPPQTIVQSRQFFYSEYQSLIIQHKIFNAKENADIFSYINEKYTGLLRQKMITTYLMYNFRILNNTEEIITKALESIMVPLYQNILNSYVENLTTGVNAYDFLLPDSKGKLHRLSDYKGKVIFMDFWFTGCTPCHGYYKGIVSDVEKMFRNDTNIVFMTISIDSDKNRWVTDGINSGKYTSEHATNLYTEGKGPDHPVIKIYRVFGYPRPIVIDRAGRIYETNVKVLRNRKALIEVLKAALNQEESLNMETDSEY